MATDKKGFILYADQKELFEQLSDEKAGQLMKFIFAYVNDENPVTDDLLVNLAFTPIKQQFKRDLKKWENTREGRSKAGKASAEARKKNKIQQELTNSTSVNKSQQTSTNPTVNVNVNDNVNVKDKVSNNIDSDVDFIYSLYPAKCLIKNSSTGKSSTDKNKIKTILKTISKDRLQYIIDRYKKECTTDKIYMKNFGTFLNNLPDYDSKEIDLNKLDENFIYYQWNNDPTNIVRRVPKEDSETMFKNQAVAGYTPTIFTSIKNKKITWKN